MFQKSDDGVLISIRVVPRASPSGVDGVHDGAVRVRISAAPVDGAANKELCRLLAKELGVRSSDVQIVRGERGRSKIVLVRGLGEATARSRLLG